MDNPVEDWSKPRMTKCQNSESFGGYEKVRSHENRLLQMCIEPEARSFGGNPTSVLCELE